jgi:hypothetical protein
MFSLYSLNPQTKTTKHYWKQWTKPTPCNLKLKKVVQDCNFKEQLKYFKSRDKKVHKMKKHMVHVLSNLNVVIRHAFIKT